MSGTTTRAGGDAGTGPSLPTGEDETDGRVSEEEVFEVLSNTRRRYVLHVVAGDESETHEVGALSERIAAWENGVDRSAVTYQERKRVYTSLQQLHLPRLDRADLVDYDKDRGTVDAAPALGDVEIYLDVVRGRDVPWSEYYLGLSGVSAALLAAMWVDAFPFDLLPDLGWFAVVVAALVVSAVAHYGHSREMVLGRETAPPELD